MTEDEIHHKKAGRQYDAEIAALMGWTNIYFDNGRPFGDPPTGNNKKAIIPRYSTSNKAALKVLYHWRRLDMCCCIDIGSDCGECWVVSWVYDDDRSHTKRQLFVDYYDLPEAITKSFHWAIVVKEELDAGRTPQKSGWGS
jgi:hypothetical protein